MKLNRLLIAFALAWPALAAAETTLVGGLPRSVERSPEDTPGLDTEYGVVRTSEGVRLRTILTRPAGATGPLPAIFVTQAVSCGSIEFPAEGYSTLRDLAQRSGRVLIRVERAGTGDSEGLACSALDYDTEVRHYREAFDQAARHPWVDPDGIVIHGISLGSTTAPLVARGKRVAGIMVQGGGAVTYLERMINFDRIDLELSDKYPVDRLHEEMLRRIAFHQHYLIGKRTPEEIAAAHPSLAGVWESLRGTDAAPHYGRPYAWHWQAAEKDFVSAWAGIDAPVLVVHGEFEQFEPEHGHRLIVDTVNRLRPGTATFVQLPNTGHGLRVYGTREQAYRFEDGIRVPEMYMRPVLDWLARIAP